MPAQKGAVELEPQQSRRAGGRLKPVVGNQRAAADQADRIAPATRWAAGPPRLRRSPGADHHPQTASSNKARLQERPLARVHPQVWCFPTLQWHSSLLPHYIPSHIPLLHSISSPSPQSQSPAPPRAAAGAPPIPAQQPLAHSATPFPLFTACSARGDLSRLHALFEVVGNPRADGEGELDSSWTGWRAAS